MRNRYKSFFLRIFSRFIVLFPGSVFSSSRRFILNKVGFNLSQGVIVESTARFISGEISIGDNTYVGDYTVLTGGEISIGANCDISLNVTFHAGSHEIGLSSRRAGGCTSGEIVVSDGTWIGASSTILSGAYIGSGSIVAAGSVVLAGVYPDNVLLAGVPAKVKKKINV